MYKSLTIIVNVNKSQIFYIIDIKIIILILLKKRFLIFSKFFYCIKINDCFSFDKKSILFVFNFKLIFAIYKHIIIYMLQTEQIIDAEKN